ncbi:hypothetical protein MNBD_PLANCTO02-2187 [hydrothermal vent metagenome]|uniref:Uncharacterized protein n=1 Tax=hydrothermal vent metagenome TaxID=652676 RepID=A0A3B1E8I0_9ZZZZ
MLDGVNAEGGDNLFAGSSQPELFGVLPKETNSRSPVLKSISFTFFKTN